MKLMSQQVEVTEFFCWLHGVTAPRWFPTCMTNSCTLKVFCIFFPAFCARVKELGADEHWGKLCIDSSGYCFGNG